MPELTLTRLLPLLLSAMWLTVTAYAIGHALLHKRDPRAAMSWIALSALLPYGGPLLYFLFGINRVRTRARRLRKPLVRTGAIGDEHEDDVRRRRDGDTPAVPHDLVEVARIGDRLTQRPLLADNRVAPLHNGEQAYPRMLAAIEQAQHSVMLASYIFETNDTGRRFIAALARAQKRGIKVRVLLDGVSDALAWPSAQRLLEGAGVRCARFNPLGLLPPSLHMHLRNHRKLLLVDGQLGYTGGINIGDTYLAENEANPDRVIDLHFELRGPILQQLADVFLEDWHYASGERWKPELPQPPAEKDDVVCRVVTDGPNEDLGNLTLLLTQALAAANRQVCIMTPYFLPPREVITALQAAAVRGVDVTILLPRSSDNRIVDWATRHLLWQLLERGVTLLYRPLPFAHTKLLIVDGRYLQFGSANLDPRSLRLNFEMNVEAYDSQLAATLSRHFIEARAASSEVTLKQLRGRPLFAKLRDAVCWLFSPYL